MKNHMSTIQIRFEDVPVSEANVKAEELRDAILDASHEVEVNISKDNKATMDFGSTLVLLLGAPAAVAVAKGIADYLRRAGGTVTISADGSIETKNISGNDVASIAKALTQRK
jgi:hypothetical protein